MISLMADLEAKDLASLRGQDLRVGGLTLVRAIDISGERPRTYRLATHNNEPLYALPGGQRATVAQIVALLKNQELPQQQHQ